MTVEEIAAAVASRTRGGVSADEAERIARQAVARADAPPAPAAGPAGPGLADVLGVAQEAGVEPGGGREPRHQLVGETSKCFLCQYDFQEGRLVVYDPVVVLPDGSRLTPSVPTLEPGNEYVCRVTIDQSGDEPSYSAEIVAAEDVEEGGEGDEDREKTVFSVPICRITSDDGGAVEVKQLHVGAIVVSPAGASGGVESLNGKAGKLRLEVDDGTLVLRKDSDEGESEEGGEDVEITDVVQTVKDLKGKVGVIGGPHITVTTTDGNSVKISYDEGKEEDDEDDEEPKDPCSHPEGAGVDVPGDELEPGGGGGGGGVGVPEEEAEDGGGGAASNCCGNGTSQGVDGGTSDSSPGRESDSPAPGPGGKPMPTPVGEGAAAQGSAATGSAAGQSSGLQNYSSIPRKTMEDTQATVHASLTSSKTMNESPFKTSGNYRAIGTGGTTSIYDNPKGALYGGTHSQLTNTKKMNSSPWAEGKK